LLVGAAVARHGRPPGESGKIAVSKLGAAAMQYPQWIWQNGRIKPWAEATTHVMSHALHYGSSVFEGIRCYDTPNGPAIFRLGDHTRRLFASAKIYEMALPYSLDEINAACREVVKRNDLVKAYLRPVAWRGLGGFGLSAETPIDVAVAAWQMGAYLGDGVLEAGIDACVSSWQRFAPNTIPAGAKAGGNYLSGQLVAREARRLGFGEGIALASTGLLSEGAGENLFLVIDGALHTTPVSAALLNGITRNTLITLARDNGIAVVERDLPREYLYLCDELFMCGTAAEITPIRSVDGRQVGAGKPGPLTRRMQELFFGLFDGSTQDKYGWLEPL
jgi:branched-chain amino acid aminotransferase